MPTETLLEPTWTPQGVNLDALGANLDALELSGVTPATPRHSQSPQSPNCDFDMLKTLVKLHIYEGCISGGMIFTRVAFLGDRYLRGLSSQIVNHYDVLGRRFASLRRFEQIFVPKKATVPTRTSAMGFEND